MKSEPIKKWKWYGFDLDGTIADNTNHAFGYGNIGKPIKPMISLMKRLHRQGCDVRIFTARLGDVGKNRANQRALIDHIWKWCDRNLGFRPQITDRKDASMECIYDDRARQVIRNKGIDMSNVAKELAVMLDSMIEMPSSYIKKAMALRKKCRALGIL